jgi:hypothetical protein
MMPSPARRTVLVALVTSLVTSAVVGGATLAFANHQWSDVPAGNPFHADVGSITTAGCASGFPGGTFHPNDPVLRGQSARWWRACGTRIAQDDEDGLTTVPAGSNGVMLNQKEITAGAQSTGGGYVLGITTFDLSTTDDDSADFPCTLALSLASPTAGHTGAGNLETGAASFRLSSAQTQITSSTLTEVWEVDAGETLTVRTNVAKFGCDAAVSAEGDLTLLYIPFNGVGLGSGG